MWPVTKAANGDLTSPRTSARATKCIAREIAVEWESTPVLHYAGSAFHSITRDEEDQNGSDCVQIA